MKKITLLILLFALEAVAFGACEHSYKSIVIEPTDLQYIMAIGGIIIFMFGFAYSRGAEINQGATGFIIAALGFSVTGYQIYSVNTQEQEAIAHNKMVSERIITSDNPSCRLLAYSKNLIDIKGLEEFNKDVNDTEIDLKLYHTYLAGDTVFKDIKVAEKYLQRALKNGSNEAKVIVAKRLLAKSYSKHNIKKVLKWYEDGMKIDVCTDVVAIVYKNDKTFADTLAKKHDCKNLFAINN